MGNPHEVPSKLIDYRNGIVRFRVPRHWREDYDPSGGATFYEDSPDSGTLRVHSLTFEAEAPLPDDVAFEALSRSAEPGKVERLQNEMAIARSEKSAEDELGPIFVRSWQVAVPVPPNEVRIVVFSYTVGSDRLSDPLVQNELEALDSAVRLAEYSREPGIGGDYLQPAPNLNPPR